MYVCILTYYLTPFFWHFIWHSISPIYFDVVFDILSVFFWHSVQHVAFFLAFNLLRLVSWVKRNVLRTSRDPDLAGGEQRTKTGWWFGTFSPIYWESHHPNWLIFFRGVQTTNQKNMSLFLAIDLRCSPIHLPECNRASIIHADMAGHITSK